MVAIFDGLKRGKSMRSTRSSSGGGKLRIAAIAHVFCRFVQIIMACVVIGYYASDLREARKVHKYSDSKWVCTRKRLMWFKWIKRLTQAPGIRCCCWFNVGHLCSDPCYSWFRRFVPHYHNALSMGLDSCDFVVRCYWYLRHIVREGES